MNHLPPRPDDRRATERNDPDVLGYATAAGPRTGPSSGAAILATVLGSAACLLILCMFLSRVDPIRLWLSQSLGIRPYRIPRYLGLPAVALGLVSLPIGLVAW